MVRFSRSAPRHVSDGDGRTCCTPFDLVERSTAPRRATRRASRCLLLTMMHGGRCRPRDKHPGQIVTRLPFPIAVLAQPPGIGPCETGRRLDVSLGG